MPFVKSSVQSRWWRKFWRTLARRPRDYVFFWRS